MCENVIAETFSKQNILKNEQVCMEPPGQPPKSVFRLHETTVFANGTGPSKLRIWHQRLAYWAHFGARNADLGSKLSQNWWVILEVILEVIGRVIWRAKSRVTLRVTLGVTLQKIE